MSERLQKKPESDSVDAEMSSAKTLFLTPIVAFKGVVGFEACWHLCRVRSRRL